jgi:hypothetical protein
VRKIVIQDGNQSYDAYIPENQDEIEKQILNYKKQNLKEHLYIGYLLIGTVAFTLGILISLKRLNGKS